MPFRQERSAGVLVYRIPPGADEPEFLLLDYGRHWDYPKGHVESGEDDLTAAKRELEEETGIADAVIHADFRHEMTYFFRHKKRGLVRKTVVFFLGRAKSKKIKLSDEHVGAEFLPYEKALKRVTYDNAKAALRAAKTFLDAGGRAE
jgi:8-oxo-dGTP pyrophosphatase MutT (NUDIX family)